MKEIIKIVKASFPILALTALISSVGGVGLQTLREKLAEIIPIAILTPAFIDMLGDLGSILSARFSTDLFLGKVNFRQLRALILKILAVAAITITYLTGLSFFLAIGFFGFEFNFIFFLKLLAIAIFVTFFVLAIIFTLGIVGGFAIYRAGHDPHNYLIPILTASADLFGLLSLSGLVLMFLY